MKKPSLEQRIVDHLTANPPNNGSIDLWALANALYDNCMQSPKAGNGIRIANLRRAAEKSTRLSYYVGSNHDARLFLKK